MVEYLMPIVKSETQRLYPLTQPQKRIWYTSKIFPDSSMYNLVGLARIKGNINFELLEQTMNHIIKQHDAIRIRISEDNNEVFQYISPYEPERFEIVDFSHYSDPDGEYERWKHEQISTAFLLTDNKLYKIFLIKIKDGVSGYFLKFSHIISDGWSISILVNQIPEIYSQLKNNTIKESDDEYSYMDYIAIEDEYLQSAKFQRNKQFWNTTFETIPPSVLDMTSINTQGAREILTLNHELNSAIRAFCSKNSISLHIFYLSVLSLYINKAYQRKDFVIGLPVFNRLGSREKRTFGMYTSTMPLRIGINDELNIIETCALLQRQVKKSFIHQRYPYNKLVDDLKLGQSGNNSLFDFCFNYYNTTMKTKIDGNDVNNEEYYNGHQFYALQMVVKDWDDIGSHEFYFDYKTDLFSKQDVLKMFESMVNIMTQIIEAPCTELSRIHLLSKRQYTELIYDFNKQIAHYMTDKTVIQVFEEHVENTPDKIVASFNGNSLTYKQLNDKTNQLCRYLQSKGINKEDIICIITTHSFETLIGILGVLKAGAAFLPVDYAIPPERLRYILEDSKSKLILHNVDFENHDDSNVETIDLTNQSIYTGDSTNIPRGYDMDNLAYIIYTSGSTGLPKGVMIEHGGLFNYIMWASGKYFVNNTEKIALYSSLAFDLTITSIFTPLICGGEVVIYHDDGDEFVLYTILKEDKVDIIKLTPSHLYLLKDKDLKNTRIKTFIVGGEDLKSNLAEEITISSGGKITIYNEYGPTECVVGCMIHEYDKQSDTRHSVSIGKSIDNTQVYILDNNLNPVPPGICGELYVSGAQIARGYVNRKDLTKEKFINNPFMENQKMYKTGDVTVLLDNGLIEYKGRVDHQVKIRGYRIEPGEIEKVLSGHQLVESAIVIDREDTSGIKYLCAYIVAHGDISIKELRTFLNGKLPDYMIPAYFSIIDSIPLTSNGKVDRDKLPVSCNDTETTHEERIQPATNEEKIFLEIVSTILHTGDIRVNDDFYFLGGDSIKAIEISAKLYEQGIKIKVKDILSNPVISEMITLIKIERPKDLQLLDYDEEILITPIMSWFFRSHNSVDHYTQSFILKIDSEIDTTQIEAALNAIIHHYDAFKINFNKEKKQLFYNKSNRDKTLSLKEIDLAHLTYEEQLDAIKISSQNLKKSFDIEHDMLLKACCFNLGRSEKRLFITLHHLISDGISLRILLDELKNRLLDNNYVSFKTNSFQTWAKKLHMHSEELDVDDEISYWQSMMGYDTQLSEDYDLGPDLISVCDSMMLTLSKDQTAKLINDAGNAYNITTSELLLIALSLSLYDLTNNTDIIIELEGHGREEIDNEVDVSRTIGWFTTLYPIQLIIDHDILPDQIKSLKEQIHNAPGKGFHYSIIKYLKKLIPRNNNRLIRFNYLGDFQSTFNNDIFSLSHEDTGSENDDMNELTCLLEINAMIVDEQLQLSIMYSKNKFMKTSVNRFINYYREKIEAIIDHCLSQQDVIFTPSDFDTVDITSDDLAALFE